METEKSSSHVLTLALTLPLTLNHSYHIVRVKGSYRLALTQEADDYKDEIAILAFQALTGEFPVVNGPRGGEYRLELVQHLNKNTRDVDANVKLVMDGICRGIGLKDNRVFEVVLMKNVYHRKRGKRWLEARLIYLGQGLHETSGSGR